MLRLFNSEYSHGGSVGDGTETIQWMCTGTDLDVADLACGHGPLKAAKSTRDVLAELPGYFSQQVCHLSPFEWFLQRSSTSLFPPAQLGLNLLCSASV